jgi:hypothetical protein
VLLCALVDFAFGTELVQEAEVRDREAALEAFKAVGTGAALLTVAWAGIELAIGVDLLSIVVFAVLAAIALVAVLLIFALQRGWFAAYFDKTSGEDLASNDAKRLD